MYSLFIASSYKATVSFTVPLMESLVVATEFKVG